MVQRNPSLFNTTTRSIPRSLVDAKGDIVAGTGDNRVTRFPAGSNGLVLFADSTTSTGLAWGNVAKGPIPVQAITGNATLAIADMGKLFLVNGTSTITLTVPSNITAAIPIGSQLMIARMGTGTVSVVAASTVTITATPGLNLRALYSAASLIKTGTNSWLLFGDLST